MAVSNSVQRELLTRHAWLWRPRSWAWVPEATAGVVGLAALDLTVCGGDPAFPSWPVNPFLIVVLLIALRYGGSPGFGAGLLAAGTYLAIARQAQQVPLGPELIETRHAWLPVAFVLCGLLVGLFVQALHEREAHYRRRSLEAEHEAAASRRVIEELRGRADGSAEGAARPSLFERVRAMRTEKREQLCESLLDVLVGHLEIEAAALYDLDGPDLKLRSFRSNVLSYQPPERLDASEGLPRLALERGRLVTNLELRDRPGHFRVCAPLRGPGDRALGVVGIQRVAFHRMNAALLRRLSALLDWAGACLAQRRENGEPAVFEPPFLALYLDSLPQGDDSLELVCLRIAGYGAMPGPQQYVLRGALARLLLATVRSADFVCETGCADMLAIVTRFPRADTAFRFAVLRRVRQAWLDAARRGEPMAGALDFAIMRLPPSPPPVSELLDQLVWKAIPVESRREHDHAPPPSVGDLVR